MFLTVFTSFILVNACRNEEKAVECLKCAESAKVKTKDVVLNNTVLVATCDYQSNENLPVTTVLTELEIPTLTNSIDSFLDMNNIIVSGVSSQDYLALALFYKEVITGNANAVPSAALLYYNKQGRAYASYFEKESGVNNSWVLNPKLSGLTTFISKIDFYKLNTIRKLETAEVLLFIDRSSIPSVVYPTIFQVKLNIEYENARPTGSGGTNGGGTSSCTSTPECTRDVPGWCIFQERQNGPESVSCFAEGDCPGKECMVKLNTEEMLLTEKDMEYLYWIRDSVLMNSEEGQKLIDDYYYSGMIMNGKIPFTLAWKLYKLFGIDLFSRFPKMFTTPMYDNDILISDIEHDIIIDMCEEAGDISSDQRFQSIIANVKIKVNNYHNQPSIVIKNDFQ